MPVIAYRLTVEIRPDTEDKAEALEDAAGFLAMAKEGWYGTIRQIGDIEVIELPEEE